MPCVFSLVTVLCESWSTSCATNQFTDVKNEITSIATKLLSSKRCYSPAPRGWQQVRQLLSLRSGITAALCLRPRTIRRLNRANNHYPDFESAVASSFEPEEMVFFLLCLRMGLSLRCNLVSKFPHAANLLTRSWLAQFLLPRTSESYLLAWTPSKFTRTEPTSRNEKISYAKTV